MSKLREAAEAVLETFEAGELLDDLEAAIDALRDALAEDRLDEMQALTESDYREPEYELWGIVTGGYGGRWPIQQANPNEIWPAGTALYVRRGQE
jgi:hypothetical protein